jgi:hypothetical protein
MFLSQTATSARALTNIEQRPRRRIGSGFAENDAAINPFKGVFNGT